MENDKRDKEEAVPDNLGDYLNEAQLYELRRLENFGWSLKFVRRPLFQEVTPVVFSPDGSQFGVLENDGSVNMQPDIQLRD